MCAVDREKLVRHHSGHYRHKTASVWDPHPQYEFTAFGHLFHLILVHDSKFVSPDIKVSNIIINKNNYSFVYSHIEFYTQLLIAVKTLQSHFEIN